VISAADTTVRALAIGQVGSTRSALEALQQAYFLECSAAEQIFIRDRAVLPVATIPFMDLGLATSSGGDDEPLAITLGNDLELPAQLALSYPNMAGDYQAATEFSDRLLSGQQSTETIQTAIGLLPAEAKAIVDGLLMDRVASLAVTTIKVPLKYARLEPGDVINAVGNDGRTYRLRIQSKTDSLPVLELQCVLDDVGAIDSAAITDDGYVQTGEVIQLAGTVFGLLDIPILRDADDAPGYYIAVAPKRVADTDRWGGAVVAQAWDGVNYAQMLKTTARGVMGTASTVLAPWLGGPVFDEASTVTVQVSGELASSTREAMLLDETINALLLGSEILRFRTAALLSEGTYLLTGLLRGQRGTEWAMGSHAAGERCVLLGNSLRRLASQTNEIGLPRQIKAVTLGQFLSTGAAEDFTDTGVALKPFSLANPRALADGADLVVSWQRRTRRSYQYSGPAPVVPLGEAVEAYRVRVYAGSTLLRSDVVNESAYRYTADMQAADGLASGSAITFEISQLSATVGPGYPSTVGATTA
uniref:phage tail protein n=1 Tax=Comamonas thiooxydans TaxID=363952 RepID=UPI000579C5A4